MGALLQEPNWVGAAQALVEGCIDLPTDEDRVALLAAVCRGLDDELYPAFIRVLWMVGQHGDHAAKAAVARALVHALRTGRLPAGRRSAWGGSAATNLAGAYGRTRSDAPYPWFDFDNEAGARLAVNRLVSLGHRRIALIHGPRSISFVAQRLAGFRAAMSDAGLAVERQLLVQAALDRSAGRAAMASLLAQRERPTAVLVDNNLAGVGAIRALLDAGKPVPATYEYPIQVWRLGDGPTLVTLGGEVVVDYALRLKQQHGADKTWVAGYSNDVMAYIPSRRVLAEGGYEGGGAMVYYGLPSPWTPEVEETIVRAVDGLIAGLK